MVSASQVRRKVTDNGLLTDTPALIRHGLIAGKCELPAVVDLSTEEKRTSYGRQSTSAPSSPGKHSQRKSQPFRGRRGHLRRASDGASTGRSRGPGVVEARA